MRSADPVGLNEIPENTKCIMRSDLTHHTLENPKNFYTRGDRKL